jgi:hypothetical protein
MNRKLDIGRNFIVRIKHDSDIITFLNNMCKVTKTDKEISVLIESGFEFICEKDDFKFFRKPK